MRLRLHDIALPLRHAFTIAHGTTTVQRNLLVELEQDGVVGYGEAAPSLAYGAVTVATIREALESVRAQIEAATLTHPPALWDRLQPALDHHRFALCALDAAAHDLWGKLRHQPVWRLWGLDPARLPFSNYTIGLDTIPRMIAKMKEFDGWPIYKIKLGTDDDLAIVRALRRHTDAVFRIDANTAWTAEQTIAGAPELRELGVEFIEQPLPRDDWDGMKRVHHACALPVIADESCQTEADVARCAGHFHGINIKLTKAGGLTPARRMIDDARRRGLLVMAGCMKESSVGISAIAPLLPLLDCVDMDGALLIARDIARGVRLEKGRPILPDGDGLGIEITDPSALAEGPAAGR